MMFRIARNIECDIEYAVSSCVMIKSQKPIFEIANSRGMLKDVLFAAEIFVGQNDVIEFANDGYMGHASKLAYEGNNKALKAILDVAADKGMLKEILLNQYRYGITCSRLYR